MPFPIGAFRNLSQNVFGMPDQTEIIRDVETEDEPGYPRNTPQVIATTKSRGEALSAEERIVANQAGYHASAKRFLPFGTDLRPSDRLRIAGEVYDVVRVNSETSDAFKAHVECVVSRRG